MMCGEIFWVDLGVPFGSEPGFRRPCLVIQSDSLNNSEYNTVVIIPLTTNLMLADYKGNVLLEKEETRLSKNSVALTPQITAVDKRRLGEKIGKISIGKVKEVVDELLNVIGNLGGVR